MGARCLGPEACILRRGGFRSAISRGTAVLAHGTPAGLERSHVWAWEGLQGGWALNRLVGSIGSGGLLVFSLGCGLDQDDTLIRPRG